MWSFALGHLHCKCWVWVSPPCFLPDCTIKDQITFSFGCIQTSWYSQQHFFLLFWRLGLLPFSSPSLFLLVCGIQNWLGHIIPSLNARAVCIPKLYGFVETADPNAIPSRTPSPPTDTTAHFSLSSYLSVSRAIPKRLYPSFLALLSFPGSSVVRNRPANEGDVGSIPGSGRRRMKWQPTLVFLPGISHGQRSLGVYSPWGHRRVRRDLATKEQAAWFLCPLVRC